MRCLAEPVAATFSIERMGAGRVPGPIRPARASLLLGSAVAGLVAMTANADKAAAQSVEACGPLGGDGVVVCRPGGNPYPDGIFYATPPVTPGEDVTDPATPVQDLTIVLDPGVAVAPDPGQFGLPGVGLQGFNDGAVTLSSAEGTTISTGGDQQSGVLAITQAGDVNITAPDIATAGDRAHGIDVFTVDGDISVVAGTIVTQARAAGLFLTSVATEGATGIAIEVESIETSADRAHGIDAFSGQADIVLDLAGSVRTSGSYAHGALVNARNSDVTVTGAIANSGDNSRGLYITAAENVTIVHDGTVVASGTGSSGILAIANQDGIGYGDATIVSRGFVSSSGTAGSAISANTYSGNVMVDAAAVETQGTFSTGILAQTRSGDVAVTVGTASATGDIATAVSARVFEDGNVSVTSTGRIDATGTYFFGAIGVFAQSNARTEVELNDAFASGVVSSVVTATGGDVRIGLNGSITSDSFQSVGGDRFATILAVAEPGYADTTGTIALANRGSIETSGLALPVILARATSDIVISGSGSIRTTGDYAGAIIATSTAGNITIGQGRIETAGANANAISLRAEAFDLVNGNAGVSVGTIIATGDNSFGIDAFTIGTTRIDGGSISLSGRVGGGIRAQTYSGIDIDLVSLTTAGDVSRGINARVFGPDARIDIALVDGSTTGDEAPLIIAAAPRGAIAIASSGRLAVSGAGATLIDASAAGAVSIALNNASVSGAGSRGIVAVSGADANVTIGGAVTSATQQLIELIAAGRAGVTISAGGSASAAGEALRLESGSGSTLANAGVISGGTAALRATGGAATVTNSGAITGAVILTGNADTIANSGALTLGTGTSFGAGDDRLTSSGAVLLAADVDFGTGNDSFVNQGLIAFGGPATPGGPRARTLAGLESLANSGLIDLADGIAGDVLTLPGAFAGAAPGALALDVNLASPGLGDRLVIGGAATGTTRLVVDTIGQPRLIRSGITVVQAGAGTSPTAFAIDPASRFAGFIEFGLAFDPATSDFALVGAPAPAAYRLTRASEGAQTLWLASADAVTAHLATARETRASGLGFWFQALGAFRDRDEVRIFVNPGFAQSVDLGYRQDLFGGQFGFDFGAAAGEDGIRFGITGGYLESSLDFRRAGDGLDYEAYNGGVYAALRSGAFFATGLVKYDHYRLSANLRSVDLTERVDGDGYGARLEAGFRFGSDSFYLEPVIGLSYLRTDLDGIAALGAAVDFESFDGLRGSAGMRLAGRRTTAGGQRLTIYAAVGAVEELAGDGGVVFATGADALRLANDPIGTHAAGKLGFSVEAGRVTGFIEAEGAYGSDYRSGGGRVGLRVAF